MRLSQQKLFNLSQQVKDISHPSLHFQSQQNQEYFNKGEVKQDVDPSFSKSPLLSNKSLRPLNKIPIQRGHQIGSSEIKPNNLSVNDNQDDVLNSDKRRSFSTKNLPFLEKKFDTNREGKNSKISTPLLNNLRTSLHISSSKQDQQQQDERIKQKLEKTLPSNPLEAEMDQFINLNDIYYKHMKGQCICFRLKSRKQCEYIKYSHLKYPFNQPQAQSIYSMSFLPKQNSRTQKFDQSVYENLKTNQKSIEGESTHHTDFIAPKLEMYGVNHSFKPVQHYEANPFQVGRSHYQRDFLQWGSAPYEPIKGFNQRTTIEEMPFRGLSTYSKDFHQMEGQRAKLIKKKSQTTFSKQPIPFLGSTANKEQFQPYKNSERAQKIKLLDERVTGAPSFNGQFQSMNQREFIKHQSESNYGIENDDV